MWQQGYRNAGVVLQSYLPRSEDGRAADERARRARAAGERRLQGAAARSPIRRRRTSTRRSSRSMQLLLAEGTYPAIATHDPAMIDATRAFARRAGHRAGPLRVPDALRHPPRPAGAAARRRATGIRVYVPFGREWFPYFMRRLGERPANVGFVIRGVCCQRALSGSASAPRSPAPVEVNRCRMCRASPTCADPAADARHALQQFRTDS